MTRQRPDDDGPHFPQLDRLAEGRKIPLYLPTGENKPVRWIWSRRRRFGSTRTARLDQMMVSIGRDGEVLVDGGTEDG